MIALPFLTRTTALLAPVEPHPDRDDWLTEQIANWRPTVTIGPDPGARLQNTLAALRTGRYCARCDVAWRDEDPCFSCGTHPKEGPRDA